jgi:hypothetical protein
VPTDTAMNPRLQEFLLGKRRLTPQALFAQAVRRAKHRSEDHVVEVTRRLGISGFRRGRDVCGRRLDRTDFGPPFPVYKLVRLKQRLGQESWGSSYTKGHGRVVYAVDQPVMAPPWLRYYGYHVLAYRSLKPAAHQWLFSLDRSRLAVFEADAEGALPFPPRSLLTGRTWNRLQIYLGVSGSFGREAVMVQRLTLRRRINEEVLRGS